jgi:hypothetical protein
MSAQTVLIVILPLLLAGALPTWPHGYRPPPARPAGFPSPRNFSCGPILATQVALPGPIAKLPPPPGRRFG